MAVATPARPRANTSRLFIIAGAVLAALAFVLVILLGGRGAGAGASGPTIKVVAAARDIPFRTPLTKDDLQLVDWPQNYKPVGAYTTIEDVIGKQAAQTSSTSTSSANATGAVAEISIKQGQPITQNMLATSVDAVQIQPAYLPIPKGFVAITIPTGEQIGVAGFIQAGDYINVVAQLPSSLFTTNASGPPKTVTRTVFTNVHVLKVGAATNQVSTGAAAPQSSSQGGVPTSLTVVLTECDAEYLKWLLGAGQISYTLGSYQDYKPQDTRPDPSCSDATAAKGVGPKAVDGRWGFSQQQ